jgi:hypothetical protein
MHWWFIVVGVLALLFLGAEVLMKANANREKAWQDMQDREAVG